MINDVKTFGVQLKDLQSEFELMSHKIYTLVERLQDVTMELEQVKVERDSLAEQVRGVSA